MPTVTIDRSRDALLTEFGKMTLRDRYLLPGESYQDLFARVASAYGDDDAHAQRLYDAMSNLWFMPSTPILSNGGTTRGLPISCFLNSVPDSMAGIAATWTENVWLAAYGGGIGSYWGNVRSIGETIADCGTSSGIIPFIHVMDAKTLAISQGSLRRGSAACYLNVDHPEIEEFLEIRRSSGDLNRKALNLHHGIGITDAFMEAVRDGDPFPLRSPKTGLPLREVDARALWQRILETRLHTGEPYLLFLDTVNRALPDHQRELGLRVTSSNLCSEIVLPTGTDHLGQTRTAVCCLASLNLERWDTWVGTNLVEDVLRMLDNVLSSFIDDAPVEMINAVYSAARERSVGVGVMGFHSLLQAQGVPFESALAKSLNRRVFSHLRERADAASVKLAHERGPCPDAEAAGVMERFSHKIALPPTASVSIICGGVSATVEPIPANVYNHKTLSGSYIVRNPNLAAVLDRYGSNDDETWRSITEHGGSVQHLTALSQDDRDVFKTAFEIDQRWVIDLAADRAPMVCQSQSINLYLAADVNKWDLHMLHYVAWARGLKSLYYTRSRALSRAAVAGSRTDYEECLACQ